MKKNLKQRMIEDMSLRGLLVKAPVQGVAFPRQER
jgi:hypothetical protein